MSFFYHKIFIFWRCLIQELAQELSISPEELLRISLEEWLSHPQNNFSQAANYVLQKNADLYRRLA
ncbi:hypothetical protein [Mastigocoleus testarum]|uniref:Uncharacterized protein n=1 Tax=Mastigocoleus testarum BC008 TaxID=371196 RepID=A0A0V7ZBU9_9CYAN|nr:hypothetical protein [Mastigocoleus testarum]KST61978.1 hypothetical protein BC008_08065 [Mastigocoleus testarum BC008]